MLEVRKYINLLHVKFESALLRARPKVKLAGHEYQVRFHLEDTEITDPVYIAFSVRGKRLWIVVSKECSQAIFGAHADHLPMSLKMALLEQSTISIMSKFQPAQAETVSCQRPESLDTNCLYSMHFRLSSTTESTVFDCQLCLPKQLASLVVSYFQLKRRNIDHVRLNMKIILGAVVLEQADVKELSVSDIVFIESYMNSNLFVTVEKRFAAHCKVTKEGLKIAQNLFAHDDDTLRSKGK